MPREKILCGIDSCVQATCHAFIITGQSKVTDVNEAVDETKLLHVCVYARERNLGGFHIFALFTICLQNANIAATLLICPLVFILPLEHCVSTFAITTYIYVCKPSHDVFIFSIIFCAIKDVLH